MLSSRRLLHQSWVKKAGARAVAEYLGFVFKTNRQVVPLTELYARVDPDLPVILAFWHGQHLLVPFVRRPTDRSKVLISHHRDGEINAMVAEGLGVEVIRGSGDPRRRFVRKGGVGAFLRMLEALEHGYTVALTADIPKIARKASLGLVKLASLSGRPIYPVALATSRRIELDNWDRTAINLPFGRLGAVLGEPMHVPADIDAAAAESARRAIETALDTATAQAYALADGK